ncbi:MAG: TonB-dependent receptor plug domain-containing protein [Gemmatimonadaceae bacterium]|nr:TonB-dependent receptor plug domain-containing protein [Gemmatimonadaceae bacterium]
MHRTAFISSARHLGAALAIVVLVLPVRLEAALPLPAGNIIGTVTDAASGQPLSSVEVSVTQNGRVVFNTTTNDFGRYVVHSLDSGTYTVAAHFIGYRAATHDVTIGSADGETVRADFLMVSVPTSLSTVEVTASVPLAVDTRTGNQTFKQNQYHGAPTNTTSQILQQSIAGAARAPTGEVHIRGQHAEYTYYVDGVPVPAGISGSLNELFDPEVVNQIDFQTGGWDAEYGNKNAAVVNITTKIPTGGFHADASTYGGSFNTYGQSVNASTNAGRFGLFGSSAHQTTDMRREPVVFDTLTRAPINFHNHGEDVFGFTKVQYTPGSSDVVALDLNASRTLFEVPFEPTGGNFADDRQRDLNGFANLGWHHEFGEMAASETAAPSDLFAGAFYRWGGLRYMPGASDVPQFVFAPDTTRYDLREDRSFSTSGVKLDWAVRPRHGIELKTGTLLQFTRGHENFQATSATGAAGPASVSGLSGHDLGGYIQSAIAPNEHVELRTGVRYDAHKAPFAGTQTQWSPRVRLNLFPSAATTLYLYYGRLFVPTNVEDLRAITSASLGSDVTPIPTLPERDHFYEAGLVHRFGFAGAVAKLSAYRKESTPGIDDNTVPGSAIVTSVNIARVHVEGIESNLELRPAGPLSGYVNLALNHAWGTGPITGGFFPIDLPTGAFDLDHDQRLSAVANVVYSAHQLYVSATEIYGSGLTNGVDPADVTDYGTGLLDFNRAIKVPGSAITNVSAGYTFTVGRSIVRPQLYVDNLFDKKYLLKGAFFSGASVGRPRSVQLRINVGI